MNNELDKHIIAYKGDSIYDFDNSILLNSYSERIIELTSQSSSLLELGLGHGFTAQIFSKYYTNYTILEGSSQIIKNYKRKYPTCSSTIIETFFESYETNKRFDVIVMGFILEHVDSPLDILTYYKHFLRPDGRIFIAVPNAEVMNRRLGNLMGVLPNIQELSKNDIDLGHKRYYTVDSLISQIKEAGFSVISIEGIYLKPFTTSQLISLNLDNSVIDSLCKLGRSYPELSCGVLAEVKL